MPKQQEGRSFREGQEFVDWVDGTAGTVFLFRGQARTYGTLEPKYLRLLRGPGGSSQPMDRVRADGVEKDLLDRFVREAPLHLDEMPVRRLVSGSPEENILQSIMPRSIGPQACINSCRNSTSSGVSSPVIAFDPPDRCPCERKQIAEKKGRRDQRYKGRRDRRCRIRNQPGHYQ